eukprot:CAMPEP_0177168582 /NCGR_PEP_ID=MMETSP0367-20130122/9136_1 /TAXON_ID=447022 ORGANISM="Scrippsiella hangoei-like, Strain SHHI-4" /NCGR_SAMPLE_ID=MMETSP0367 /ASSEMBLY_ACC=CAM_ASM_000362 /LENGTH=227 /DNA_ID=CAMNT_0018614711 /DNA_START=52 /DNA_END=734 /DNA_ORIENTATION=+
MSSVLQAEQKCATASSGNPKWGRRWGMPQALHLRSLNLTMSTNWQSWHCVSNNLLASPNSAVLPQEHLGLRMLTMPGDLQLAQQVARASALCPSEGQRPQAQCLLLRSTMPDSLHSEQHVGRGSPMCPKQGRWPQVQVQTEKQIILSFLHIVQLVALSSSEEAIANPQPTAASTRSTSHLQLISGESFATASRCPRGVPLHFEERRRRSLGETLTAATTPTLMPQRA